MPPRHRFLEPIHNVKEGQRPHASASRSSRNSGLHTWRRWGLGPPSLFELRRAAFADKSRRLASRSRAAAKAGGARRDRTDDLKLAKLALSQLSYGPVPARKAYKAYTCHSVRMVGRVGVEPTTSRLSGVRSNHLSYRPPATRTSHKGRGRREPAQAYSSAGLGAEKISRMKGHEDGGYVLWTGGSRSGPTIPKYGSAGAFRHDP
jgi:hypothetical protein